jgi:glycosyltransferase involved in cell wall biosynthesis
MATAECEGTLSTFAETKPGVTATEDQLLVSVILPVYNAEGFVEQTIQSALHQTYRNLEIIVVDDGSTDRTHAVLQSYTADPRVRIIRQPNSGVARARNRGLVEARGEFVAPLDSDDLWDPSKIERQVRRIREAGDDTGLVYCWWVWIDGRGEVLDSSPHWKIEGDALEMLLQVNFTGNASVPLYRRHCLEEAGGYDESLEQQGGRGCEDWDVALKVAARFRVAVVAEWLIGYRRLPNSMSTQCDMMWRSQQLLTNSLRRRQPKLKLGLLKRSDDQFVLYIAGVLFRSGQYFRSFRWAIRAWHTGLFLQVLPYVFRVLVDRLRLGRRKGPQVMVPGVSLDSQRIPDPLIPYDRIYGAGPTGRSNRKSAAAWMRSGTLQSCVLMLSFLLIAAQHWKNDGLWFQGDAPRHAANGLFWYDLIVAKPYSVTDFAVRYYARYPVINPVTYPPLFYIFEGLAFRAFGPSPYVAKILILSLSAMAGFYTMAWARRWLGPGAGWAGSFLAFVPGIAVWTNAVMLNVPATALGVACLYHWRRWFDAGGRGHLVASGCFGSAAVLTYYPAGIAVAICALWAHLLRSARQDNRSMRYGMLAVALVILLPVMVAALVTPTFLSRNLPGLGTLKNQGTWIFYPAALPGLLGSVLLALGAIGLAVGVIDLQWRKESQLLAVWIATAIGAFSLLPARNPRYILIITPAFVLAAAVGVTLVIARLPWISSRWRFAVLLAGLIVGAWSASRVRIPEESGFRAVASFLREHAPNDPVLYDGYHDGVFGFYMRTMDPGYNRRLVLGQQLLYHYGPAHTFNWVENSRATTTQEVVDILRSRSGCAWVAIEVGPSSEWAHGQRLLREAVTAPPFELVHSFPVISPSALRVDLYRLMGPVSPVSAIDLQIPSFSDRTFAGVIPISR